MIEIEIDGKTLEVEQGTTIIEAADNVGINIPRFCYHRKLSVAANCRMCLVEVEKSPKPLPACATPVTPGMKVFTRSAKALESQRAVMEFLLINHPLDCPVCDQGGQCELQDVSMGYGSDSSRFTEGKRSIADEDLGPLIATEMTRCIQCTRCVRFGQEIAGLRELGALDRGEDMRIATYVKHALQSELSGNIIELCPVGALTSKPFRFTARAWELQQAPSIAPHDCVGSHIYIHTRRGSVMRVVPRDNEDINENWLSDRDRFSYLGIHTEDRLTRPMIKRDGIWHKTDWPTALNTAVEKLKVILEQHGAQQIAGLISPNATVEEMYLWQKLLRGLGSQNIDHRLHQNDFRDQNNVALFPGLNLSFAELESQQAICLIGSDIQREQPILGHRVRQASLQGTQIFCINPLDCKFNFNVQQKYIVKSNEWVTVLAAIAKAVCALRQKQIPTEFATLFNTITLDANAQSFAKKLASQEKTVLLLGALLANHPEAAILRTLIRFIADVLSIQVGHLTEGANSAGAWLAGAVPHRGPAGTGTDHPGLNISQALQARLKAYLLLGVEPELDCANPREAVQALKEADCIIAFSSYKTTFLEEHADILFPIATFAENDGTYVNVTGTWQSFKSAINPVADVKPAWKILRVLGNLFEIQNFDYNNPEEVRDELQVMTRTTTFKPSVKIDWAIMLSNQQKAGLSRIVEWPIYGGDSIVRRAKALQQSATCEELGIRLNEKTAKQLNVTAGEFANVIANAEQTSLAVIIDSRVPDECVLIAAGHAQTANLDTSTLTVEVHHA